MSSVSIVSHGSLKRNDTMLKAFITSREGWFFSGMTSKCVSNIVNRVDWYLYLYNKGRHTRCDTLLYSGGFYQRHATSTRIKLTPTPPTSKLSVTSLAFYQIIPTRNTT